MAKMLYPGHKVNANRITQDPTAQVDADMTLHRVNTVLRSSDNATVASECSVEDVEVTVSRIKFLMKSTLDKHPLLLYYGCSTFASFIRHLLRNQTRKIM